MVTSLIKGFPKEKVVLLTAKLPFRVKGMIRLVNKKDKTLGFVLDDTTLRKLEEYVEDIEASNPKFLRSLEESRKSGIVSSAEVKRKAGL